MLEFKWTTKSNPLKNNGNITSKESIDNNETKTTTNATENRRL